MPNKKFLRRNTGSLSRLGKLRKKLQKWRRPKGRDNKMRLKEKGRPAVVSVGYKKDSNIRGKIENKIPKRISNIKDLENTHKHDVIIVDKIGKKKKIEIAKIAKEKELKILNFNFDKHKEKKKWNLI